MSHADGSSDAVVIFPFMPHDQDEIARVDEFAYRLGDDAGPDAGILFDRPGLAAVKMRRAVFFIYDDLVAAPSQDRSSPAWALSASSLKLTMPWVTTSFGQAATPMLSVTGMRLTVWIMRIFSRKEKLSFFSSSRASRLRQAKYFRCRTNGRKLPATSIRRSGSC